jgi:hypothetical protein
VYVQADSADFLDDLAVELTQSMAEHLQATKQQAQKEQEAAKKRKDMQVRLPGALGFLSFLGFKEFRVKGFGFRIYNL